VNNIQIVQIVEEPLHHMYILKKKHFTKSHRSLSFVHDPLGFISPNHVVAIFNLHQARVTYVTNMIHG